MADKRPRLFNYNSNSNSNNNNNNRRLAKNVRGLRLQLNANVNSPKSKGLPYAPSIITSPIKSVGETFSISGTAGTLDITVGEFIGSGLEADLFKTEIEGLTYAIKQFKTFTIDGLKNSLEAHFIASNKESPNPNIICLHSIICSQNIRTRFNNIPSNFFYEKDGTPTETYCYAVFEYINGVTMDTYVAGGQVDAMSLTKQLIDAVNYLHTKEIAHRDIKPSNTMITRDGQLKLIDLGSACFLGRCAQGSSTREYTMSKYFSSDFGVQNGYAINNDIYACLLIVYFMYSGNDKFINPAGGFGFVEDSNAEFSKIPEKYRPILSKYIKDVNLGELTLDASKEFTARFLSEMQALNGGRSKAKTKRKQKRKEKKRKSLKHRF